MYGLYDLINMIYHVISGQVLISQYQYLKSTKHLVYTFYFDILLNPLGPRILLKHALLFPGFMAFFERFYFCVKRSVEKNLFNIDNYKLCLF